MEKEYTYEELIEIGKVSGDVSNYLEVIPSFNPDILILRDGKTVWEEYKLCTTNEYQDFIFMLKGWQSIAASLSNKKITSVVVQTYPGLNHYLVIPIASKKNKTHVDTYQAAADAWSLPRHLNIASKAALFYSLMARHNRKDGRATVELNYFLDYLGPIFTRYLDMIVGGEARHTLKMQGPYEFGTAPADIEEEATNSGLIVYNKNKFPLIENIDITASLRKEREVAWTEWRGIRQTYGRIALDWAILAHLCVSDSSYAGPLWANAGILIRKLELGQVSPLFFVDQAFSMQHNNGEIFNKLWDVTNLARVLDIAFHSDVTKLGQYITDPQDKQVFDKVCIQMISVETEKRNTGRSLNLKEKRVAAFDTSAVLGVSSSESLEVGV